MHTVSNKNATHIDLTALIDDTGHGDAIIGGANSTIGTFNWATSAPMATYNDEALADIPNLGVLSSDDYTAPNNYQNLRQIPDDGRYEHILEASTTTGSAYNYASGTGADKWAYYQDSDNAPSENVPNTRTELTATQYTQISASDDSRHTSNDPGWNDYVSIYGVLHLNEAASEVAQVTLSWEGYVSRAGDVNIYARDQTAGTWTLVASAAASTGGDGVIQGTLTGVTWSNYVTGTNNEFIFLVQFMTVDPLIGTTTMTTDYISVTTQKTVMGIDHRWQFNMGANPTFYIDASNPAGADSDFTLEWSDDNGGSWNGFSTPIVFTPGEVDVLKSSPIALATYYPNFLVRVIATNQVGTNLDTFSIDRMWAEGQFNNNPEAVYSVIDISTWQPGTYQLYVYGWDQVPQYNTTSMAYATLMITDGEGPEIYEFQVNGTINYTGTLDDSIIFTGLASDENTGRSNIANAFITIDGEQSWNSSIELTNDTWLDSINETFTEHISLSNWSYGTHQIFM